MNQEWSTQKDKGMWTEVKDHEGDVKALLSHTVLRIEKNKRHQPKNSKAKVVAGGNEQIYLRDNEKIYVPVLYFKVSLLILIIAFVLVSHKKFGK